MGHRTPTTPRLFGLHIRPLDARAISVQPPTALGGLIYWVPYIPSAPLVAIPLRTYRP